MTCHRGGGEIGLEIVSPEEGTKYEYDEEVVFTAELTASGLYQGLETEIEWEILTPNYQSVVPAWEDWKGTTFTIEHIRDCWLTVKASLTVCGVEYSDERTVRDWVNAYVEVEDGTIPLVLDSQGNQLGENEEIYWINGSALPIFNSQIESEWDSCAYNDCDIEDHVLSLESDDMHAYVADLGSRAPYLSALRVGQIRLRVCIDEPQAIDYYDVEYFGPMSGCVAGGIQDAAAHCGDQAIPLIWPISDLDCGQYTLHVDCYKNGTIVGDGDSKQLTLGYVTQADIVNIAPIYLGDDYHWGGHYNPHSRPDTVDCCGYLTQLLRRFARCDGGTLPGCYPIAHRCAVAWRACELLTDISFQNLQPGDLIVWRGTNHVAIFAKWDWYDEDRNSFRAIVWESNGAGGVDPNPVQLRSQANPDNEGRWHMARHWVEGVVFPYCP